MKSFYKENPFGEDLFSRILSECNEIDKSFNIGQYSTRFGRYDSVFEFSKDIESKLIEIAKKEFKDRKSVV